MAISKKKRLLVYAKCGGHCGYCGKAIALKDMQVDHMFPQCLGSYTLQEIDGKIVSTLHELSNLMPSCRQCNHYKHSATVEQFRQSMTTLHERLKKIYTLRVGENFGIVQLAPFEGTFFFERYQVP